ncbi:hypothetical protein Bca52824_023441 [Brassica carinata]|uniref:Uncharacterized protein n=1 Tax=Brassica carinata TaxID=52824 RepID=A0A8X7VIG9_BRACI|nr:hypothetical protein Bca52824_023441 [Brassica carinata]
MQPGQCAELFANRAVLGAARPTISPSKTTILRLRWRADGKARVIERLRADQERIKKKTLEEKEAPAKFEELEAGCADRCRRNSRLRERSPGAQLNFNLRGRRSTSGERDAVAQKLIEERQRLKSLNSTLARHPKTCSFPAKPHLVANEEFMATSIPSGRTRIWLARVGSQLRTSLADLGGDRPPSGQDLADTAPSLVGNLILLLKRPLRRNPGSGKLPRMPLRSPAGRSYHPGGIFEELAPPPFETSMGPGVKASWGTVRTCSTYSSVRGRHQHAFHILRNSSSAQAIAHKSPPLSDLSREDSPTTSPDRKRKQRLLKKAREMSGTPDLSALLKGKLQLLKKSATTGSPTRLNEADASPKERSESPEQPVDADPPAAEPLRRGSLEGSQVEKKKKKTKRSREGHGDGEGRDSLAADSTGGLEGAGAEERPERKLRRRGSSSWRDPRSRPTLAARRLSRWQDTGVHGSPAELLLGDVPAGTKSPDGPRTLPIRNPGTPLVCNPGQCAELSRQIRGGPRELPPVDDLVFKDDYIEASLASRRADGSVNVLVEKHDSGLKQHG